MSGISFVRTGLILHLLMTNMNLLMRIIKHLLKIKDKQSTQTAILIHFHLCSHYFSFNKSGFCDFHKEYLLSQQLFLNIIGYLNPQDQQKPFQYRNSSILHFAI